MMPRVTWLEYSEIFRHGLTAGWRLHIAMDCGRGSLVKLWTKAHGIFQSTHLCWLHTTPEWERHYQPTSCLAGHPHCRQLRRGGWWLGKVQIKQLGRCMMWPLWLWHKIEARVVMLSACIGRRGCALSPRGRLFMASQVASNDRPWDNYHRFASFCAFVQLLLWIRSVPVSNARVTSRNVTSIGLQSPLLGLRIFIQKYKTDHVLGQKTWTAQVDSLPVAKTDVQKLPTMLEQWEKGGRLHSRQRNAGMHSHECTQVMVKLRCRRCLARVAATCDIFNNRWYILKTGYRLETDLLGYRFNKPSLFSWGCEVSTTDWVILC